MLKPTCVQRAFEIAREKGFSDIRELERQLGYEGYEGVLLHLNSSLLRRALRQARDEARRRTTG